MEQAIQVSPAEDVMALSSMFSRAAQAIVDASTLPGQIAELQAQLADMRDQFVQAQLHSVELDHTLAEARAERDTARAERDQAVRDLDYARESWVVEAERLNGLVRDQENVIETLRRDKEWAIGERDGVREDLNREEQRTHALSDDLSAARAKLAKIEDHFRSVFGITPAPEVQAEPTPEWPWNRQAG